VDGEGVNCHSQALRMYLRELFATRIVFEEAVVHVVCDLFRPCPVDLVYLFSVGVVSVQPTELALHIPEQE